MVDFAKPRLDICAMINRLNLLLASVLLSGCLADETISGFTDPDREFMLVSINDGPATGQVMLRFPEKGVIAGKAQCNSYSADQVAPYPWFETGLIRATLMTCPEIDAEREYLGALSRMRLAEVSGNVLILSTEDGEEMVFHARED